MVRFFERRIQDLRNTIPEQWRDTAWIMFDGAPCHTCNEFRHYIEEQFNGRVVMKYSTIPWPPRSPDLNILDSFFWGTLKTYIYEKWPNPPGSIDELNRRIGEAMGSIPPEMIRRAQRNIIKRAKCCLAANGGHFEHLLKDYIEE